MRLNKHLRFFGLGRNPDVALHHAKFIISRDPQDKALLAFTSANFGKGIYGHFENWAFTEGSAQSQLFHSHFCFLKTLEAPSKPSSLVKSFADCRKLGIEDDTENKKISTYFIPYDKDLLKEKITTQFQKAKHIEIQTQHLSSDYLLKLIEKTSPSKIRILADGDIVKLRQGKASLSHYWEMWMLSRLHLRNFKLRFIGNSAELDTLQHNKTLLFKAPQYAAVLTGSGNLSNSGLGWAKHPNAENFYFIEDTQIHAQYLNNFKKLWAKAHNIEGLK